MKVFISSTNEDLLPYPKAASDAVNAAEMLPVMQEYWTSSGHPPLATDIELEDAAGIAQGCEDLAETFEKMGANEFANSLKDIQKESAKNSDRTDPKEMASRVERVLGAHAESGNSN